VKVGLQFVAPTPGATADVIATVAVAAEERGVASLWVGEHVVRFDRYESAYPYSADGAWNGSREEGQLEQFALLSYLAAHTRTLRLGSGITLVPQRNPVYTAKSVATIDWLSGGRFDFGLALGWSREEYAAAGAAWEGRALRCREYVALMKTLWLDAVSEYNGRTYTLAPARMYPKPVQAPHPPIYVGGESDAALRRVAELGDGWYGWNLDPVRAAERVRTLHALLRERGREPGAVSVVIGPGRGRELGPGTLEAYAAAGVDQVVVPFDEATVDSGMRALDRIAAGVVAPAAALAAS
jgi:probable F420-dependent oxidoreductase